MDNECQLYVLRYFKKNWEAIRDTYSRKKNLSRAFKVYVDLFSLRQGDNSLEEYYSHFNGMIDELN